MSDEPGYTMRAPCTRCGHSVGRVSTVNGQDTVRCELCGTFQYNAPRIETGREKRSVTRNREPMKPSKRARILERDGYRCQLCGSRENLHVGHAMSVKHGPAYGLTPEDIDHEENLLTMCDECNLGQGDTPISQRIVLSLIRYRIATRKIEEDR